MFYVAWWFQTLRIVIIFSTIILFNSIGFFPNNEHYWEALLGFALGGFIMITLMFNIYAFIFAVILDAIYVNNKFYQEWRKDHHPFWHKFTLTKENFAKNNDFGKDLNVYSMEDPRLN